MYFPLFVGFLILLTRSTLHPDNYLDDMLNINNVYFDNMVSQIYPAELQLNKVNTSDTGVAFIPAFVHFL